MEKEISHPTDKNLPKRSLPLYNPIAGGSILDRPLTIPLDPLSPAAELISIDLPSTGDDISDTKEHPKPSKNPKKSKRWMFLAFIMVMCTIAIGVAIAISATAAVGLGVGLAFGASNSSGTEIANTTQGPYFNDTIPDFDFTTPYTNDTTSDFDFTTPYYTNDTGEYETTFLTMGSANVTNQPTQPPFFYGDQPILWCVYGQK
ncbi:hypothetical protein NEDG_01321 [Nematocida displodere]|uniref:Uncharacterized protein n=1 Tax=Nematocida displodere TaxID=1805483 RepID=A0A177EBQ2_9MICR|nr:hypothetical protein NEDG_01321 [Nematocida displodere]